MTLDTTDSAAASVPARSGRPCFTRAGAVWHLPDGPFRYATLTPTDVIVKPGSD